MADIVNYEVLQYAKKYSNIVNFSNSNSYNYNNHDANPEELYNSNIFNASILREKQ